MFILGPVTATGKVDRKPLRAERWDTGDPIWWRPAKERGYRRLDREDVEALADSFRAAGRGAVLR